MKTFRLFSMAALALAMAACSSEDSALENAAPAQQQGAMKFTATLAAPGSGATTRTTYTEVTSSDDAGKINVAWKAGDQIYLYDLENGATCTATVGTPAADGSATISGTFDQGVEAGDNIIAFYPASAANDASNEIFQEGTLAFIQDNLDYRKGTSTISVSGDQATLATALEMESQIAIWKLTLQNSSSEALSATKVAIKDGSSILLARTKDISATSVVCLALSLVDGDISGADITIEATVGSDTYTYSKSGVSLAKGKYYQSTLKMAKAAAEGHALSASAVGEIVGTDGKAYAAADKDNLPTGVTAVAMVAYKSGSNGLAIALADESSSNWSPAKSTCEGKTAIGGNSWKLPSQDDWKAMFSANGGNEEQYSGLNTAITTAGGTTLKDLWYWSSSEGDGGAWGVYLGGGNTTWRIGDKDLVRSVRACLAF